MPVDDPLFLVDAFQQVTSISATLGGLAFTAAAALLSVGAGSSGERNLGRAAQLTAGAAVAGALCFVMSMILSSMLAGDARVAALQDRAFDESLRWISRTASVAFLLGLVGLFVAIGASGWIGSRGLGRFTTVASAAVGVAVLALLLASAT